MNQINKIFFSTYCTHTGRRCKRSIKQAFGFDEGILVFVKQAESNTSFYYHYYYYYCVMGIMI